MNKRGISAVVATVLIILITISSISIVWLMIMPLIRENLEFNSIERGVVIVTSGGYTVYDPERKIAAVKVKMEEDTVEIPFVEVIFMVDGNSIKFVRDFNLEINEDILFYFILNKKPESVSVAPIFRIGNKEKVGSIYNSVQLKSGDLTPSDIELYDGLVSYWRFEGDALDTAGNNNGILNGDDGELIINRGAETGTINGWNFGGATGLDNHSGSFSFYQEGFGNVKNSELISLDLNKVYHLGGWLKSYGTGGDSRIYFGFTPYDVNKDLITASDVRVVANTKTRFYEDCQSTDTKFTILDGSNWVILYHGSIAFNIDGSGNYADLPNRNRSNNLGTKNNEPTIIDSGSGYWNITLGGGQTIGKPCSAGEEIRQHTSGSNHIYAAANFDLVPLNTWNYYSGDVSGMAISGNPSSKWWHGTKYFKVMFLLNYFQTPTEKIRIDDISLNTTPPTYTGPLWIDGISGQAISFDGDNDYVIIADDPSLQFGTGNFSITAWIYPTPNTGKTRIANNRGTGIAGSSPGWEFKIEDFGGGWRFMDSTIDDGSTYATCDGCGGTYSYDQWYHVAMIYEAGVGLRFYVDGVLDGSVSIPSFGSITNSLPTAIGAAVANNGVEGIFDQHYKGKIDEVMIFNRMISGVEVGEIYNSQR